MQINGKNKILFLGLTLLLFGSYQFAIKNSLNARKESQRLEMQKNQVRNIPKTMAILRQRESYYDSILKKMDIEDISVQNNLLRVINQEAKKQGVNVMDFNKPHIETDNNNQRLTYSFSLSGGYTGILRTIHTIEQKGSFGEIVHLNFQKKHNYHTNQHHLDATVFVQQMK